MSRLIRRMAGVAAAAATVLALAAPAAAAPEDYDLFLPAGLGCEGFGLGIDISGGNRIIREFTDENGNVVRILETGRGTDLTFTNDTTGASLVLRSSGSVSDTRFNSDGTRTVSSMGHTL